MSATSLASSTPSASEPAARALRRARSEVFSRLKQDGIVTRAGSATSAAGSSDDEPTPFQARVSGRLELLRRQLATLKERVEGLMRAREEDVDWRAAGAPSEDFNFAVRRTLLGHGAPVYALAWSGDDVTLASAALDGRVVLWDSITRHKRGVASLESPWVMTTAFDRAGKVLLAGGLDARVTVMLVRDVLEARPTELALTPAVASLEGHRGYVTAARFLTPDRVVSASGDATAALWDLTIGARLASYGDHGADVTGVAPHPADAALFATSSADGTLRLWDARGSADDACVLTYSGFGADATGVDFFSSGTAVAGTSADSTLRLFDLRSSAPLGAFTDASLGGATGLAVSRSGRLVFAAYEDEAVVAWEVASSDGAFHKLEGHTQRVRALALNSAGQALATAGDDRRVAVWC